jgi:hypothetical protein
MMALRNTAYELDERAHDHLTGRGDPQQRFRVYRLCVCEACEGLGKLAETRCPECRGEGRVLDLVATAGNAEGVGTAIIQLAREGELAECPLGVLDTEGEVGAKWLVSPWLPSPRNVHDAAVTLGKQPKRKGER